MLPHKPRVRYDKVGYAEGEAEAEAEAEGEGEAEVAARSLQPT